jgi:hypothetical protein
MEIGSDVILIEMTTECVCDHKWRTQLKRMLGLYYSGRQSQQSPNNETKQNATPKNKI